MMMVDMRKTMIDTLRHNPTLVQSVVDRATELGVTTNLLFAGWYADEDKDPTVRVWPTGLTGAALGAQYNQYRKLIHQGLCMALVVDATGFTRVRITRNGTLKHSERHDYITEAVS